MRELRIGVSLLAFAVLLGAQVLPAEPRREAGDSVTGAFEGWFKNADGTYGLLLGYFNRNQKQEVDVPIGPNNRIEPGGPDRGQPTHFLPGRGWGVFTITVPADFGDGKLTWTLVANGKTTVIPASLKTDYEISPFREASVGNTPPSVRFSEEQGSAAQGPNGPIAQKTAAAGTPTPITLWISDDAKFTSSSGARPEKLGTPVSVRWSMYRGPARVAFSNERPVVDRIETQGSAAAFNGKATTMVTFPEPGIYMLEVIANDYSGEGGSGFQCCWTHALLNVTVK